MSIAGLPVEPGRHRLDVSFAVVQADAETRVAPLTLATTVEVPPRGVVLVTRDDRSGALVVRQGRPGAAGKPSNDAGSAGVTARDGRIP